MAGRDGSRVERALPPWTDDQRPLPPWGEELLRTLPPLLSRKATSSTCGWSDKKTDRLIRNHELAAIKSGNRVLVPRGALVAYLAARGA